MKPEDVILALSSSETLKGIKYKKEPQKNTDNNNNRH
jgi:hypothetical protein